MRHCLSPPSRAAHSTPLSRRLTRTGTGAAIIAATLIVTANPALAVITIAQPTVTVLAPGETGEVTFSLNSSSADPVGKITFTAPGNTTFTRASYTWNGGPGTIGCGVSVDAKTLDCPATGLDPRPLFWFGAATIGVQLAMDPAAPADTTMTPGTVTNFDHSGIQNAQGPYTAKTPPPDLTVDMTDSADPVALGASYSYTATVTNDGPGAATGVTATTTLSGAAGSILSAVPSQGSCAVAAPTVTCTLGTLPDSASATVTVDVEPTGTGTITATTAASGVEADPDTGNNTDAESTTIDNTNGCTITGTAGNDTINGSSGNDVICGFGGNDIINGGNGNDTIYGGTGADDIDGGNGDDQVYGGAGNDDLDGQNGDDVVSDVEGGDTDTTAGGSGNDDIDVQDGAGGDTANGGLGSDTCTVDTGDTTSSC